MCAIMKRICCYRPDRSLHPLIAAWVPPEGIAVEIVDSGELQERKPGLQIASQIGRCDGLLYENRSWALREPALSNIPDLKVVATTRLFPKEIFDIDAVRGHNIEILAPGSRIWDECEASYFLENLGREIGLIAKQNAALGGYLVPFGGRPFQEATIGIFGIEKMFQKYVETWVRNGAKIVIAAKSPRRVREYLPNVEVSDFESLADRCDIAMPLSLTNHRNRGLMSSDLIGRLKPTAVCVDYSVLGAYDYPALYWALTNRRIAGYVYNFFRGILNHMDHFSSLPNVHVSKNQGGAPGYYEAAMIATLEDMADYLLGRSAKYALRSLQRKAS
jgi:phosphoglycerate dehydrogenase-like enzyme